MQIKKVSIYRERIKQILIAIDKENIDQQLSDMYIVMEHTVSG